MTIEKSIMMLRLFLEYISSFLNYSLAFFHGRGAGNKKVMRVISIRLGFFFLCVCSTLCCTSYQPEFLYLIIMTQIHDSIIFIFVLCFDFLIDRSRFLVIS